MAEWLVVKDIAVKIEDIVAVAKFRDDDGTVDESRSEIVVVRGGLQFYYVVEARLVDIVLTIKGGGTERGSTAWPPQEIEFKENPKPEDHNSEEFEKLVKEHMDLSIRLEKANFYRKMAEDQLVSLGYTQSPVSGKWTRTCMGDVTE